MTDRRAPILVTGAPRAGTSFVGKLLQAGGGLVYINEPMNPRHPPGGSPGVLNAAVAHYFEYICDDNGEQWLSAFRDTVSLRYHLLAELRANRAPYDLARLVKYATGFAVGRLRGEAALIDDPYAVMSVAWLVRRIGVRAVVIVREPVGFVGSWRNLGWTVDPGELLDQPLLMRDHLEGFREELQALSGSRDWLATSCLVWRAIYHAVDTVRRTTPEVLVCRYEDLSTEPLREFRRLYEGLGLGWTDAVEAAVSAGTSGGRGAARAHPWSLRGGLSRTGFRPMDSRGSLQSYRSRLGQEEIDRVLALTRDVRDRYYAPISSSPRT
jgi:sulfotransferase family protein